MDSQLCVATGEERLSYSAIKTGKQASYDYTNGISSADFSILCDVNKS